MNDGSASGDAAHAGMRCPVRRLPGRIVRHAWAVERPTAPPRPGRARPAATTGTPRSAPAWSTSPSTSAQAPMPDWLADPIAAVAGRPRRATRTRRPAPGGGRRPARPAPGEVLLTAGAAAGVRAARPGAAAACAGRWWCTRSSPSRRRRCGPPGTAVERVLLDPADGFRLDPARVPADADLVMSATRPTRPRCCTRPPTSPRWPAPAGCSWSTRRSPTPPSRRRAGEPESLADRRDLPGLVVLRSLTKTWGLAGLRIGYLLGAAALLARLAAAQPLWAGLHARARRRHRLRVARRAVAAERAIAAAARRRPRPPGRRPARACRASRVAGRPASAFVLIRVAGRRRGSARRCASAASRCAAATPSPGWAPTGCGSRCATLPPPTRSSTVLNDEIVERQ